jgi:hypothetical protein
MTSLSIRGIGVTAVVGMLLLTVGCSSSTKITFNGPPNSVLFVDGKPHHLPTAVDLERGGSVGSPKRHDVSLTATVQEQELRAKGYIDVFGYTESDVDKLAVNRCDLDEQHLAKILEGTIVIFKGQSASRQPLFELTLSKQ